MNVINKKFSLLISFMKLLFFTREKVSVDNGKILLDDAMLTMSLLNWLNKREHKSTLNRLSKFLEKNIV